MKTFIFGAGATIPFFSPRLDTTYLTGKVCCIDEWVKIIEKYRQYKGKNHNLVSATNVTQLIQIIQDLSSGNSNFEQIAEIIDKISSYGFDCLPLHNMLNLMLAVMNKVFQPQNPYPFGFEWHDVPFLLREIIAEAILNLQNNHKADNYQDLINLQHDFIRKVCEVDDHVSVMSLNYDDCVLESLVGLGFEKGFRPADESCLMQMDIPTFMQADKVVYFPHGHIKFQFIDNANVAFYCDSNRANQERWENIEGLAVGATLTGMPGKFAYNYNTFISTGQTKDDGLNQLPYAIYYQRLAIDLYKSDTIYIIGYSFGDFHINRLLRSFISNRKTNKVVIVDFHPDQIDFTDTTDTIHNIVYKIHYYLGTDWQLLLSPEEGVKPYNQQAISQINQEGFGELFPQVFFYRKGYSEFLNQIDELGFMIHND